MCCCQPLALDAKIKRNREIDASDLDGEKVMMDLEKGQYFMLNEVGGAIWDLLETPMTVSNVVDQLMKEYDVEEEECLSSVQAFLHQMLHANLVTHA